MKIISENEKRFRIKNNLSLNSSSLSELICLFLKSEEHHLLNKVLAFLTPLMKVLTSKRDSSKFILSWQAILDHLELDNYIELVRGESNGDLNKYLINQLNCSDINLMEKESYEIHSKLINPIRTIINEIVSLDLFSDDMNNSIPIKDLFSEKNIIIINSDNEMKNKLLFYLFKTNLSEILGNSVENVGGQDFLNNRIKSDMRCVFLRNIGLIKNIAVSLSQARAVGFSVTLSYQSVDEMKMCLGKIDFESVLACTLTKIISSKELSKQNWIDVKNFEKTNEILHFHNDLISLDININYEDGVMLIKDKELYQIKFDI